MPITLRQHSCLSRLARHISTAKVAASEGIRLPVEDLSPQQMNQAYFRLLQILEKGDGAEASRLIDRWFKGGLRPAIDHLLQTSSAAPSAPGTHL